jgi:hypothetical protein
MQPILASPLSPVQDQVIAALANGASFSDAAAGANVHRNTIGNWRRSSTAFRSAFANALYDRAMCVREEAASLAQKAIRTIEEILTDSKVAPSVRLKAALAILAQASAPPPEPPPAEPSVPQSPAPQIVHNSAQRPEPKIGRNEPCPCRSGRKFKLCCLNKPKSAGDRNSSVTNVS